MVPQSAAVIGGFLSRQNQYNRRFHAIQECGLLTRVVIPAAVTAVVAFGTWVLWQSLQEYEFNQVERVASLESYSTRSHLARSSETLLDALINVRDFWDSFGTIPPDQWQSDAYIEFDHFAGIELLLYQQSSNDIRFLRSSDHPGFDYRPDDLEWARHDALLSRLAEQTESVMMGPFLYPDGRMFIEVYIVNEGDSDTHGLVALIDSAGMIGHILMDEAPSYSIEVYWRDQLLYRRDEAGEDYPTRWDQVGHIELSLGAVWRVVHRPTQEAVDAMTSGATDTVLVLGFLIAVLMGFLTFESARARRRAHNAETAEKELARLNRDLESIVDERTEALRMRTQDLQTITDSVAHDLRNPLGAISMNVQFIKAQLQRGQTGEAGLKAINRILPNIGVISAFLDRLMGLSALNHETFEREPLDMRELVRDVFETLEDAEPNPPVELVMDDDLPGVSADELLVRVLVTNLLANALKYTRDQQERRVEIHHARERGVTVYTVRDNGIGFDMAEVDQLFGAFKRLTDDKRFEGTGLGLTIVARVIERHEGRIRAEGEPGRGAAFHFTLEPDRD